MSPRAPLAMLATGAAVVLAAPAHAATVSGGGDIDYNAAAGETNQLTISRSGANYLVTDPGATITPGSGCVTVTANQASCAALMVTEINVELDDLNDTGTIDASVVEPLDFVDVSGEDGNDTLNAGPNVQTDLAGDDGEDTLNGNAASDDLDGGEGNDTMFGGDEGDDFEGDTGNDTADGGAGDDDFDTNDDADGADSFVGGPGDDRLDMTSRSLAQTVTQNGLADDGENCPGPGCEGDNLGPDVEEIDVGSGADTVVGGDIANNIDGADGADVLDGGGGTDDVTGGEDNDVVRGGAGADELDGDDGVDSLEGNAGDDVLFDEFFDSVPDAFSGGKGTDLALFGSLLSMRIDLDGKADDGENCPGPGCEGDNVLGDIEDLEGGAAADVLVGNKRANDLTGGRGADRLVGGGGADGLHGDEGGDNLNGGKARDLIEGDSGADRIKSRDGGPDQVFCGSSRDVVKADASDRASADCDKVKRKR